LNLIKSQNISKIKLDKYIIFSFKTKSVAYLGLLQRNIEIKFWRSTYVLLGVPCAPSLIFSLVFKVFYFLLNMYIVLVLVLIPN